MITVNTKKELLEIHPLGELKRVKIAYNKSAQMKSKAIPLVVQCLSILQNYSKNLPWPWNEKAFVWPRVGFSQ